MSDSRLRLVVVDDEVLARERVRRLLRGQKGFEMVGAAGDGPEAVVLIRQHRPHIALLDIRLPGLNGFEVLAALGQEAPPAVIFVTAHGEYASRAFEVQPIDYLLKPFSAERFHQALGRARARCAEFHATRAQTHALDGQGFKGERLALKCGKRSIVFKVDDIHYVAAANTVREVVAANGSMKVTQSLSSIEVRLPRDRFVRVSRSALVNVTHVLALHSKSHGDQYCLLPNHRQVLVARTCRRQVLERLLARISPHQWNEAGLAAVKALSSQRGLPSK